ncbi:MAG: hypothetical protein ACJ71M_17235 [Nitrososphaeraceae archaeon]
MQTSSYLSIYNKESKVIGAQEHDFGIWRGSKSTGGIYRDPKARTSFCNGGGMHLKAQ